MLFQVCCYTCYFDGFNELSESQKQSLLDKFHKYCCRKEFLKVKALFFQGDRIMTTIFDGIDLNIGKVRNYLPVLSIDSAWTFVDESFRYYSSSSALRNSPMHDSYTVQHLHDLFSELYGYEYHSPSNVGEDTAATDDPTGGDVENVENENQEEDMEEDEEEACDSEEEEEEPADESDEEYQDQEEEESKDMDDDEVEQEASQITNKPQKKKGFVFISAYSKRHDVDDIISDCKHYAMGVDLSMGVTFASSCDGVLRTGYIKTREDEKLIAPYEWANGKISRKSVLKPSDPNYYQIKGRAKKVWQHLQSFGGQPGHMDYTSPITCLTECHMTGSFKYLPKLDWPDTQATKECAILFTDCCFMKQMRCDKHPEGCGTHVKPHLKVKIAANLVCLFVKGGYWFIPVHTIGIDGGYCCCIGVVKTLPTQAHLVANRIAIVVSIHEHNPNVGPSTKVISKLCGYAVAKFIDGNDTKIQVGFSQWPKDPNIHEDTNHKKKKRKSG